MMRLDRLSQESLHRLHNKHPRAHFHVHIDAVGQYAVNLERFVRTLDLPMTVSVGEPKRNKDYQRIQFPKRKSDATESHAMARFGVIERPGATPRGPMSENRWYAVVFPVEYGKWGDRKPLRFPGVNRFQEIIYVDRGPADWTDDQRPPEPTLYALVPA